jgi:hypothetical protein
MVFISTIPSARNHHKSAKIGLKTKIAQSVCVQIKKMMMMMMKKFSHQTINTIHNTTNTTRCTSI